MKLKDIFDQITQVAIPVLTIGGFFLISIKRPGIGILLNFTAQPFWLYSSWKSYKDAGQTGILINVIMMTLITGFGVINYFIIK